LWQKDNTATEQKVERFTIGKDRDFDILLAACDVQGSLAHTEMLSRTGLLTLDEKELIHEELMHVLEHIQAGLFFIGPDVEDVHSQVELMLTQKLGDIGKKIHSGRSRNDQVAVDIKLFLKEGLLAVKEATTQLFMLLIELSEQYSDKLMPGYTHLQVAMPS